MYTKIYNYSFNTSTAIALNINHSLILGKAAVPPKYPTDQYYNFKETKLSENR